MSSNINRGIIQGTVWVSIDRFSHQIIQLIVGIVIARFVTPMEYGVLGIIMVFITVSEVFIDSGLGSSLIYYNNCNKQDLQTTFTFNLIVSVIIFIVLFISSPYIESFFVIDNLSTFLRASIFVLLVNSFILVPSTILKIQLNFRALAISNMSSVFISGVIGVMMAYNGYGVWALISQLLSKSILQFILVNIQCRWLPNFSFTRQSFLQLYNYGIKIFGATCITKLVDESTSFFVGKLLTPFSLGLFTRANQFASVPGTAMGTIVSTVLFPSMSSLKDDNKSFDRVFQKAVICQAAISIPLFFWLAMLSEPLIKILLTDRWIALVPVMQILCIGRSLMPIANISEQVLKAKGRSDLFFKQQFVKMLLKIVALLLLIHFGLLAVAFADAIYTMASLGVTCYYLKNVNRYSFYSQIKDIFPFLMMALCSAVMGYLSMSMVSNDVLKIIIGLIVVLPMYYWGTNLIQSKIELKTIIKHLYEK